MWEGRKEALDGVGLGPRWRMFQRDVGGVMWLVEVDQKVEWV